MNAAWIKFMPSFIRSRLDGHHGLQSIISNTAWLVADKVLRMGVGLVVGVWIARYLGPAQFGLWNFAIAFAALFGAFATGEREVAAEHAFHFLDIRLHFDDVLPRVVALGHHLQRELESGQRCA